MEIDQSITTETVEQVGPVEPVCIEPDVPLRAVIRHFQEHSTGQVLICRDGALVGILTERDVLRVMADVCSEPEKAVRAGRLLDSPVEQVMVADPVTIRRETTVINAIRRMTLGGFRRLPIVDDDNRPLGVIHVAGLVHYLAEFFPSTVFNQPPVAYQVTQEREGS